MLGCKNTVARSALECTESSAFGWWWWCRNVVCRDYSVQQSPSLSTPSKKHRLRRFTCSQAFITHRSGDQNGDSQGVYVPACSLLTSAARHSLNSPLRLGTHCSKDILFCSSYSSFFQPTISQTANSSWTLERLDRRARAPARHPHPAGPCLPSNFRAVGQLKLLRKCTHAIGWASFVNETIEGEASSSRKARSIARSHCFARTLSPSSSSSSLPALHPRHPLLEKLHSVRLE